MGLTCRTIMYLHVGAITFNNVRKQQLCFTSVQIQYRHLTIHMS